MKIFLLTTFALSVILCLGSVLEPIQQYGVGPKQVLNLLLYFLPVTLTFVLPVAALFASTLAYGRLAGDNELDACKASGISPATIVYPGVVLAIIVAIANLVLSFHVMPYFVQHAEASFKANAKQILFRNVQRRGFWRSPDGEFAVYADDADLEKDTLSGVIVIRSRGAEVDSIYYAELAKVFFESEEHGNTMRVAAYNALEMGKTSSMRIEVMDVEQRFGSLLEDQIEFKRIDDMKHIQADPLTFYPNEERVRKICKVFTGELLYQAIKTSLDTKGVYEIYPMANEPNGVSIKAGKVQLGLNQDITLSEGVEVKVFDVRTSRPLVRFEACEKATLMMKGDEFLPSLLLDLSNARAENSMTTRTWYVEQNLSLPEELYPLIQRDRVLKTLSPETASSFFFGGPSPTLAGRLEELKTHIRWNRTKIIGTIHSRLVFGIGCIPMIIIGTGLGIIKRGGHLLTAFGTSCLPALILIVCIISGKHVAENPQSTPTLGLTIMWAGLGVLSVLTLSVYGRLNRH
ncbi:MAG: LptF/LptG family permease [Phycisphaerae bacterium]|nr:LptF/LptG family permease [Phycisphaerae bacterium]